MADGPPASIFPSQRLVVHGGASAPPLELSGAGVDPEAAVRAYERRLWEEEEFKPTSFTVLDWKLPAPLHRRSSSSGDAWKDTAWQWEAEAGAAEEKTSRRPRTAASFPSRLRTHSMRPPSALTPRFNSNISISSSSSLGGSYTPPAYRSGGLSANPVPAPPPLPAQHQLWAQQRGSGAPGPGAYSGAYRGIVAASPRSVAFSTAPKDFSFSAQAPFGGGSKREGGVGVGYYEAERAADFLRPEPPSVQFARAARPASAAASLPSSSARPSALSHHPDAFSRVQRADVSLLGPGYYSPKDAKHVPTPNFSTLRPHPTQLRYGGSSGSGSAASDYAMVGQREYDPSSRVIQHRISATPRFPGDRRAAPVEFLVISAARRRSQRAAAASARAAAKEAHARRVKESSARRREEAIEEMGRRLEQRQEAARHSRERQAREHADKVDRIRNREEYLERERNLRERREREERCARGWAALMASTSFLLPITRTLKDLRMDAAYRALLRAAVRTIQKSMQRWAARAKFRRRWNAALVLQRSLRYLVLRRRVRRRRRAAAVLLQFLLDLAERRRVMGQMRAVRSAAVLLRRFLSGLVLMREGRVRLLLAQWESFERRAIRKYRAQEGARLLQLQRGREQGAGALQRRVASVGFPAVPMDIKRSLVEREYTESRAAWASEWRAWYHEAQRRQRIIALGNAIQQQQQQQQSGRRRDSDLDFDYSRPLTPPPDAAAAMLPDRDHDGAPLAPVASDQEVLAEAAELASSPLPPAPRLGPLLRRPRLTALLQEAHKRMNLPPVMQRAMATALAALKQRRGSTAGSSAARATRQPVPPPPRSASPRRR